jgi:hypothetical protein
MNDSQNRNSMPYLLANTISLDKEKERLPAAKVISIQKHLSNHIWVNKFYKPISKLSY